MRDLKKFGILLLLSHACCNVSGPNSAQTAFGTLEFNPSKTDEKMPGKLLPLPATLVNRLHRIERINELFEVERFIKLECKDESVIGQIDSAAHLQGYWFVLDSLQKKIFKFDEQGRFVKQISKIGEGPGEFLNPGKIRRCGEFLGVADVNRSAIMLFDVDGNYIRSLPTFPLRLFLQHAFILTDQYRLYTAYPRSGRTDVPFHAILDFSQDLGGLALYGFGKRPALIEQQVIQGAPRWRFSAFEKIENRIWTGSPYSSHLDIYDLEGRFLGQLPSGMDGLQLVDFEDVDINNNKERSRLFGKLHNNSIHQIGPLVLVSFIHRRGPKFNVYDLEGNLLKKGIEPAACYRNILLGLGDRLIGSFPVDIEHLDFYRKLLTTNEFQKLKQANWDPADFAEDNPYLTIGKIIY